MPAAVSLLARLRGEGLAVSIISYGEIIEGTIGAPEPQAERERAFTPRAPYPLVPLSAPIMDVFARTRSARGGYHCVVPTGWPRRCSSWLLPITSASRNTGNLR